MEAVPVWVIGLAVSLIGLLLAIVGTMYNRNKDTIARSERDGGLLAELKYIGRTVDAMNISMCTKFGEIDSRLKVQEETSTKRAERLIVVEMKVDAHGRIVDDFGNRIKQLEGYERPLRREILAQKEGDK